MTTKEVIQAIEHDVLVLHECEYWKAIRLGGLDQRASEFITQAHADLIRCVGNLKRAERFLKETT